ncbi:family 43 glycosylhydrolase [Amycolatopsis sp. NPDC058278]|uniref:family 43 glycosylhydrolase n=1 Tax=Amycolatopsis sp. NPDC058278 TaxID=3346417 RepID=UPI0036DABEDA
MSRIAAASALAAAMILMAGTADATATGKITSGVPWQDTNGNVVNAHGGGMIKVDNTYYWIGESKGVDGAFRANACYSSTDLQHWTFVRNTLVRQASGDLGPHRVVERPKILYNRTTKQYVQTMHVDNLTYKDQAIGVATSSTVCGDYTYRGRMKMNGSTLKYWDSGSFQDSDGTGYVIAHNGNIFKLAPDYLSAVSQPLSKMCGNCESPALFKANGTYFFLFSGRTGWATNDNRYYTATSLAGPWTLQGNLAPAGTKTWNSQTTYVLPVQGSSATTYMFMGDRWNAGDLSASTYVWQPLVVNGTSLSMPVFRPTWTINTGTGQTTWGVSPRS